MIHRLVVNFSSDMYRPKTGLKSVATIDRKRWLSGRAFLPETTYPLLPVPCITTTGMMTSRTPATYRTCAFSHWLYWHGSVRADAMTYLTLN